MSLRIPSTQWRCTAAMTALLSLGLLMFGCARVHLPLVSKSRSEDKVGRASLPDNQDEDATRTDGRKSAVRVASRSAGDPQHRRIVDDRRETDRGDSTEDDNPFAVLKRRRVAKGGDLVEDPFLTEFKDTGSRSAVPQPKRVASRALENDSGVRKQEGLRSRFAPLQNPAGNRVASADVNPFDRSRAGVGGRGDTRSRTVRSPAVREENKFADGFDLQMERLRETLNQDLSAGDAEATSVRELTSDLASDRGPTGAGRSVNREIEHRRITGHDRRDALVRELPRRGNLDDPRLESRRIVKDDRQDTLMAKPSASPWEESQQTVGLNEVETGQSSPVEYLPPPPISKPPVSAPSRDLIADARRLLPPSRADSQTVSRQNVHTRQQDLGRTDKTARWPAPVELHGSIVPIPDQAVSETEEKIRLAKIVPNRRLGQDLTDTWSTRPGVTRVTANKGSELHVSPSADEPSPFPANPAENAGPVGKTAPLSASTPDALKQTETVAPTNSPRSAAKDNASVSSDAPFPPAEIQPDAAAVSLDSVNWDDSPESEAERGSASLPLPVLLGFGVALAFLVGLFARRFDRFRTRQGDR